MPAAGYGSTPSLKSLGFKSPNEKLNLATIGAGGQPFSDLRNAAAGVENVVALAYADWNRGAPGFKTWPAAARYKDFRKMLDKSGKQIDAVVIGTPDHNHATCALACMQLGPIPSPVAPQRLLFERTAHRDRQSSQAVLQDVVSRAAANAFHSDLFPQRTGYKNEGGVALLALQNLESLQAAPTRQVIVGNDDVEALVAQPL